MMAPIATDAAAPNAERTAVSLTMSLEEARALLEQVLDEDVQADSPLGRLQSALEAAFTQKAAG